jgi:RNA polymerase sigma factor (sigma-70 family)
MKITSTPATKEQNPTHARQSPSDVKPASGRRSTKTPSTGLGRKKRAHKAAGIRLTADDVFETDAYSREDVFRIYLNQIGATQLLSREQEAALGHRIRTGFNALLQHLLSSGCVGHILLDQAQAEMARRSCQPARRSALAGILTRAEAVLATARDRFVPGVVENAALNADVAAVLGELVPALGIRPDQSLGLLAQMRSEVSELFTQDSTELGTSWRWEFERKNLMDWNTLESFLAEAARLRAAVIAARNEMVGPNLRLVVSEAKKMKHAFLSVEDLVQEGNCGLIMAAERFDERLGHRFSTFAVKLIKSAMRRENDNQGRTIRLPVHRCDALRKMDDASARLECQQHRPASVEQIAKETGFACSEVRELTLLKQCTLSLDLKIGDEEELTLEAFLADPGSLTPFYGDSESAGVLDPYFRYLDDAQHNVVVFMYGIGGRPQLSLEETARTLGLNRSDVRRLHQLALESLRNAFHEEGAPLGDARAA